MPRAIIVLIRNLLALLVFVLRTALRPLRRGPKPAWVVYELDGEVSRGRPGARRSWTFRPPSKPKIEHLGELSRELDHLASVPWVRGVVVRFEALAASGPVRAELRRLLADFRAKGRTVVVHADRLDTREWHLATAAERIWLSPKGRLELTGIAAHAMAAAGALAKLGLKVDVVRAGRFKTAGELVGAAEVTEESRAQVQALLADAASTLVNDAAEGRGVEQAEVRRAIDEGPYPARVAVEAGLADGLCYADEIRESLAKLDEREGRAQVGSFSGVLARAPAAFDWKPLFDRRGIVAVVQVHGIIAEGRSRALPGLGHTAGSRTLVEVLRRLKKDPRVKAVVLHIDSRGGSALASDLIWHAARKLDERKPVVAFLDSVAASGGYYIAAGARRIVASPECVTGSIGVFSLRPDASGLLGKLGIDRATLVEGANAALLEPMSPLDERGRASLERDVMATWDDFVGAVAEGRRLEPERVREVADGRVMFAPRAMEAGLVDALGTLDDAVNEAGGLAGLRAWRVVDATPRDRGLQGLIRSLRGEAVTSPFSRVMALWEGEVFG